MAKERGQAIFYCDVVAFPGDGLTTTAEFAVISHEKVQEYEADAGIQKQTDQRLTK